MSAEDNPRHPLDGILEGLAESIAHEDADELLREAQSAGRDPKMIADSLRSTVSGALKRLEQKKLEAARKTYRLRSQNELSSNSCVALTPEGRKQQLLGILQRKPALGLAITAQHRNFEDLSDEDVASALEDLAELGYLDQSRED